MKHGPAWHGRWEIGGIGSAAEWVDRGAADGIAWIGPLVVSSPVGCGKLERRKPKGKKSCADAIHYLFKFSRLDVLLHRSLLEHREYMGRVSGELYRILGLRTAEIGNILGQDFWSRKND